MRGLAAAAAAAVALAGWTAAGAPFTAHFAGLESALEERRDGLAGLTDPVSEGRRQACERSLLLLLGYSPSVAKDLKVAAKIAKTLERVFDPGDLVLVAAGGTLDGLEGEIAPQRALLEFEIGLLSGAKQAKAAKGLAAADLLLAEADLASTATDRAKGLGRALRKVLATRRALRSGAPPGFQGPVDPSFEAVGPTPSPPFPADLIFVRNAALSILGSLPYWKRDGTSAPYAQTGQSPTHGLAVLRIGAGPSGSALTADAYQERVNLSRSRRLLFDLSASNNVASGCAPVQPPNVFEIRFSLEDTGTTVVLFRREYAVSGSSPLATETVELPFLPERGIFTIRATAGVNGCLGGPGQPTSVNYGSISCHVDNIRVE